jgi:hypothetical protein
MAKSGSAEGSNAYIWLVPERRMVMVVMANRDKAGVAELGEDLRSIVLGAASATGKPDLVVKEFERTGAVQFKNGKWEIPFRYDVVNQGSSGANISFVNSVQVGSKDRWTGFMNALPSKGASKSVSGVVKIPDPSKLLAGRTLELTAYADVPIAAGDTSVPAWGRIDESNDSNNTAAISVQIPGGLDLTGQKPAVPAAPASKKPTKLKATAQPQRLPAQPLPAADDTQPRVPKRAGKAPRRVP